MTQTIKTIIVNDTDDLSRCELSITFGGDGAELKDERTGQDCYGVIGYFPTEGEARRYAKKQNGTVNWSMK